jgi:hypothetical protein
LEGLAEVPGMKVVRVGQPASIRDGLRHLSLAALAESTSEGQKVQDFLFHLFDSAGIPVSPFRWCFARTAGPLNGVRLNMLCASQLRA